MEATYSSALLHSHAGVELVKPELRTSPRGRGCARQDGSDDPALAKGRTPVKEKKTRAAKRAARADYC